MLNRTYKYTKRIGPRLNNIFAAIAVLLAAQTSAFSQWQKISPLNDTIRVSQVYAFGNTVFAGFEDGSFYISSDHGDTWMKRDGGLPHVSTRYLSVSYNNSYLFISRYGKDPVSPIVPDTMFYRSSDLGVHWEPLLSDKDFFFPKQVISYGPSVYVANYGGRNVYISSDNGSSWRIQEIQTSRGAISGVSRADSILFARSLPSSHDRGSVSRSTDNGYTWSEVNYDNFPSFCMQDMISSGPNVFVSSSRYTPSGCSNSGVVFSSDYGNNWKLVEPDCPPVMHCFGSTLVTASEQGIRMTTDLGGSWQDINYGVRFDTSFVLSLATDDTYLYAGVQGRYTGEDPRGIFRCPLAKILDIDQTLISSPASIELLQNSPNPFTTFTAIRYEVTSRQKIQLKVYDMLGRLVATLLDKVEDAGQHQVTFDGSGIPAGMYVYSMQSGSGHMERQFCLMR